MKRAKNNLSRRPERRKFNPKRSLKSPPVTDEDRQRLDILASTAKYVGNPDHKLNPGDFGFTPQFGPRPGASLCDKSGILKRKDALRYLRHGLMSGMVSTLLCGDWPKYVWTVTDDGVPIEGQGDANGQYHGYPLDENDPFRTEVIKRWNQL